ncbi:MAG: HlyD family secretion protein [Pseudomonadota bacterium]
MAGRFIRWIARAGLLIAGPVAVLAAALYIYVTGGRFVSTENAYVKAELIIVTPEVSGRVTDVEIGNNQPVSAGDVLFRLDPRRFEVEVARRAAELRTARQRVTSLKARYRRQLAELAAAKSDLEFQRDELERSDRLRSNGTISKFRLLEVRRETTQAETRIEVIREEIAEALSELGGDPNMPPENHPDVLGARAELEQANLDLGSTVIRAPANAVTANVRLQVGEYVEEGDPVLSLVGREVVWVVANLKETDLTHLSVGQAARLTVDAFPDVTWTATVSSLSPATGAEYALLPPQNASGNWVKVVQRIPVRLDIERTADAPALRAGMSVAVSIDTGHVRPLPDVLNTARAWIAPPAAE